jgi:hypothetical protein
VPIPFRSRGEQPDEPDEHAESDLARRVLAHAGTPEEKLERLLAERSRELEEQAARFEQAMEDLERREELLRDMRASVERMLRLGADDLTEREAELQERDREHLERETQLVADEAELNRRRSELGAVELKREAVEQRERAVAAREQELAGPSPLGAEQQAEPGGALGPTAEVTLLFVPGIGATHGYRLVEIEPRTLAAGASLELDDGDYVVARLGRAPLPADTRQCAYLERDASGSSESGGSS